MLATVAAAQLTERSVHLRHLAEDIPLSALPPIETGFSWLDLRTPFLIGVIGAARQIHTILCAITDTFDPGVRLTVGDTDAHGRLLSGADICPQIILTYEGQPHYAYPANTNLYLYVEAGTPTQGAGVVTIYYQ